ncbi:MAG: response regulator [Flavobacteriaceae bacterium]|nr:response regulator [Flavobacteriaceae bacterium]
MESIMLKEEILNHRIQQVEVSEDGIVINSDNALYPFKKGESITSLHPFFEGIKYLLPSLSKNITFPCVNIEIEGSSKIVDIELLQFQNKFFLLIFDFTEHYEASHPLVQEKNESSIAKNKLAFEQKLLQAKDEFKNSFLANLNHEIRNPLNNMLGFIELLSETKLNYEQHETLKVIQKTGAHIKMLMDDMLDISKIERGVLTKKHVNFYLGSILANLQNHFELKYQSSEVSLEINSENNLPKTFKGDPMRLNQILFNLLENAFRNTKKGTVTLSIKANKQPNNMAIMQFEVSDTGVGISEDEINKIFDSYYQLKLDKVKPLGEGLGLKIVKDLVELLEGDISVTSKPGEGTTFRLNLPFELRKSKREKKTVAKGSGILISKRILIAEEKSANQMLFMKTFLNNEKGYVIEIANNATHFLELIEKKDYNLLLLKRAYPDMDGIELIQKIRNHSSEEISNLPILIASGSTMLEEQHAFLEAGATSFLPKPYSKKELFKNIEKLIR